MDVTWWELNNVQRKAESRNPHIHFPVAVRGEHLEVDSRCWQTPTVRTSTLQNTSPVCVPRKRKLQFKPSSKCISDLVNSRRYPGKLKWNPPSKPYVTTTTKHPLVNHTQVMPCVYMYRHARPYTGTMSIHTCIHTCTCTVHVHAVNVCIHQMQFIYNSKQNNSNWRSSVYKVWMSSNVLLHIFHELAVQCLPHCL